MKSIHLSIIAAVAFLPSVYSTTVVEWGGTGIVTGNPVLNLTSPTDSGSTRVFDQTTEELSPLSGYNAQPFYGIIQNNGGGGSAVDFSLARVENATPDRVLIRGISSTEVGPARSVAGLIYFKKEDFYEDAAPSYRFDASSQLSINVSSFNAGGGTGSLRVVRFAVLNEGQWYLSDSYVSQTGAFTLNNLLTQKWALYDANPALLPGSSFVEGDYTALGSDFQNIEALGFYFLNSFSSSATATDTPFLGFNDFEATVEAIPEPSTIAFLTLVGMGFFAKRRNVQR